MKSPIETREPSLTPDRLIDLVRNKTSLRDHGQETDLSDCTEDQLIDGFFDRDPDEQLDVLSELFDRESGGLEEFLGSIVTNSVADRVKAYALAGLFQRSPESAQQHWQDLISLERDSSLLILCLNLEEEFSALLPISTLFELFNHESDEVKFYAAHRLSRRVDQNREQIAEGVRDQLSSEDSVPKLYYLLYLVQKTDLSEIAESLTELLQQDSLLRFQVIETLGKIGDSEVAPEVAEFLDADNPILQFYAAEALGNLGAEDYWDELQELVDDHPDRNVRYYSLRALHKINPRRAIEPLLSALRDSDQEIRGFASQALVEFGDVVLKPYREALEEDDREAVSEALYVLGEIGDREVLPDIMEKADGADKLVEHRAVETLKKLARRDEACRRYLLEHLPESSSILKVNILRALGGLGNPELCSYLTRFLPTDNTKFRYYMAGVCEGVDDPACLHLLRRLCQDEDLQVATHAVRVLCSGEGGEARRIAIELAREEMRPLVLISYLRGFFLNRHSDFTPVVEEILERNTDQRVQYFAASALKALQPSRLKEYSRGDDYLEQIIERVRVD